MKLDERKCPRCAEAIKVDALVCKNCGAEFDAATVAAAKKKASREKLTGCLGCGGLAVVLLFAIGMCTAPDPMGNTVAPEAASSGEKADSSPVGPGRALTAQYRQLIAVATPCDQALAGLKDATTRFTSDGDSLQMMAATAAGQNACGEAARQIKAMTPPEGLSEKATERLTTAYRSCLRGYDRREQAFTSATAALAGERSDLSEAVDDIKRSQSDVVSCVAGFIGAAGEAGVDLKVTD